MHLIIKALECFQALNVVGHGTKSTQYVGLCTYVHTPRSDRIYTTLLRLALPVVLSCLGCAQVPSVRAQGGPEQIVGAGTRYSRKHVCISRVYRQLTRYLQYVYSYSPVYKYTDPANTNPFSPCRTNWVMHDSREVE